jgi:hypothetical protein
MRKLISISTLILSFSTLADIKVAIEVPINSNQKNLVLENAKTKAIQQSLDKLPSVIWGTEQLANHNYLQEIKAIGFAQAKVDILSESWDYENNSLKISADVSWDHQKVMSTLKEVQEGQDAKKTVQQIEKILNGLNAKDFVKGNAYRKQQEARLLASPFHLGMDMGSYLARYNETLQQMKDIKFQRVVDFIKDISVVPLGVKNSKMEYRIDFPPSEMLELKFESDDLGAFYNENRISIDSISICTNASFDYTSYIEPELTENSFKQKPFIFKISLDERGYDAKKLSAGVPPILFFPCDKAR